MNIKKNIADLVGNTPLMSLDALAAEYGAVTRILGKLELFNPAGSAKDRVALEMLTSAWEKGTIDENTVIIEPTSGNTGIGLAAIGRAMGLRVILTMPDTMSAERRNLLAAYGAELVLTDGALGMKGSIEKANELKEHYPNSFIPSQFDNPANPDAHYKSTGPEIWRDTDGKVDIFVAGIGTGGTISGTGRYLKEKNPDIKIVGFEPQDSPLITKGRAGSHKLQGIGANFVPENFDSSVCDEILTISTEQAYTACKKMAHTQGLLVGITSGAAIAAAAELAGREENRGKTIVAFLPDTGEHYLSSNLFAD